MDRLNPRCLFSAPFRFLPSHLLKEFEATVPTEFREIWTLQDLRADSALTAWVPNPGQNFVIDARVLDLFPALRVIATPSTGTNHIDHEACRGRGVAVFGLMDERPTLDTIASSSEFTFLLLLNALRRLDRAVAEADAGRWRAREDDLRGHELAGRNVGVVGLGRIGGRIARWSEAFGASVAYHDPYVVDERRERLPLQALFERCDVVVLSCALTEETRGMIGGDLFDRLPPGAVVVNTARGEVLREAEIADALVRRPDLHLSVDVLAGEVRDTHHDSPLWALRKSGQVLITPHVAGATFESQTKAARGALILLRRHLEGSK